MTLEVLVSTVNSNPKELIKKMNINSDAIIINQCDKNGYEEITLGDNLIRVYNFNERGIGLSRNNALMRAKADIVLFADDDEVLEEGYKEIIINEFEKNKKADMFVFNIKSNNGTRTAYDIKKCQKLHKFNSLKYGAVRFAVKLRKIRNNNVNFSLLFGGGAKYGSGEDSIFIYDCLKNKFNIYTSSKVICTVDFSESSWFSGYNEKYYIDKGALFYSLHKSFALLFSIIYLLRHRTETTDITLSKRIEYFKKGIHDMKGSN